MASTGWCSIPLGRPLPDAEVEDFPYAAATSAADGSFALDGLTLGAHAVVVHVGDGLQPGKVGYFAEASVTIAYGGHRPFVTLRMVGGGVSQGDDQDGDVDRGADADLLQAHLLQRRQRRVRKGGYINAQYRPQRAPGVGTPGRQLRDRSYNPYHGVHTINGQIEYAGQLVRHDIVFEDAASVAGRVGVDGRTPVPYADVVLEAGGLAAQHQRAGPDGRFRYELVPKGRVTVSASGIAGTVERVGRVLGYVGTAGQTLELVVQMKS